MNKSGRPTPKYKPDKKFPLSLNTPVSGAIKIPEGKEIPTLQKSTSPKSSKKMMKARTANFDTEALYLIFFCLILFSFIIITHAP